MFLKLSAMLCLALTSHFALADDGISKDEIRIGMANALSGPAKGLGEDLKAGATAYFNKVNAAGGVNGRKIKLVSLDDGYEPAKTAEATRTLIDQEKVFALFGYVGTPTSSAAVPLAAKAGIPYLFPFTGAEFLRNPVGKWVFNVRASYFDETEAMVEHLTKDLGIKKIGLFIQDDAFGEAGKAGISKALSKRDMSVVVEARFKRNTLELDDGLAAIKAAAPQAIVMVGPYKPLALFIKKAKAAGITAKFLTVSFVGTSDLISEVGADGEGVYISQVMPSPDDTSFPLVKQFQADNKGGEINYTTLEGYTDAVVLVEALKKAGANPTRDGLAAALEGLNTDLGGLKLAFSATKHQGSSQVFLTQIKSGKAVLITKP